MLKPSSTKLSWAALLVALAAFAVATSGGAVGLPGAGTVDKNDLRRNAVRSKHVKRAEIGLADLSQRAKRGLTDPRAYALVLGPGEVRERDSRGVADEDISVNNGAFCISGIGFAPKHVQVTPQAATDVPKVYLRETVACNGATAVVFASNLNYPEEFFVALFG